MFHALSTPSNYLVVPFSLSSIFFFLGAFFYPENKLFVGMLPKNVSEVEVSDLFSQYGTLKDLQILRGSQQTSKGTYLIDRNHLAYF